MKIWLSRGIALSAFFAAGVACAADLPRRTDAYAPSYMSPAPVMNWTGFYVGANAGYSWGGTSGFANTVFGALDGFQIGPTVGYNYQINQAVIGLESDWDWSGTRGTNTLAGPVSTNTRLTSLFTLRGRAGLTLDHALLYVTGGYAGASIKNQVVTAAPATFVADDWRNG